MGLLLRGGRGDRPRALAARGPDPSPGCSSSVSPLRNNPTSLMLHVGSARLDRKQRAACARAGPAGARGGRRAEGRAGPAPRTSGEFREGLLSLSPSRGNFGGAAGVRCHAGARGGGVLRAPGGQGGGGGLGAPVLQHGRRVPRRPRGRESVAPSSWPVTRGPEPVSGRSVDSPLKSNCCHV